MVEMFFYFSQKKVENKNIYTKVYNLPATGQKASGQCLFQGCSLLTRRLQGGLQHVLLGSTCMCHCLIFFSQHVSTHKVTLAMGTDMQLQGSARMRLLHIACLHL